MGICTCCCRHILIIAQRGFCTRVQTSVLLMCRFNLALHGKCSEECEDLLQHFVTVHLGSRDAANDTSIAEILPAMQSTSTACNNHLRAAALMHQRFAELFAQYTTKRKLEPGRTPWFTVALPDQ